MRQRLDAVELTAEPDRPEPDERRLVVEGPPGLPEAELEPLGEIIRSSLTGLALWWLDHPEAPRATVVAAMVRMADGLSR